MLQSPSSGHCSSALPRLIANEASRSASDQSLHKGARKNGCFVACILLCDVIGAGAAPGTDWLHRMFPQGQNTGIRPVGVRTCEILAAP